MKKIILITVLTFAFSLGAFCQNFGPAKEDSIRYNSMKSKLATVDGKEKVDLLNAISEMSGYIGAGWDTVLIHRKKEIIRQYASQALELATKIGYSDGIAMALINLNQHRFVDSIPPAPLWDRDVREKNILRAIKLAEETNNYEISGKGYDALGTLASPFEEDANYLDRFQKSEYYYQKAKDTEALANIYTDASDWCASHGNYEKAFEYGGKSIEYLKYENVKFVNSHQDYVQEALYNMSTLYSNIGDYESAMSYLKQQHKYFEEIKNGWNSYGDIASLFCEMHQYDSALVYWKLWRNAPAYAASAGGHKAWGYAILAEIYINHKQYDSAISIYKNNIEIYKSFGNKYAIAREWGYLGRVYNEKGVYDSALQYSKKALTQIEKFNDRPLMMKEYALISSVFHHVGNNDSAYEYLVKHNTIKDSIDNKQFLLRLYKQKMDAKTQQSKAEIMLLNKDNALKTGQLKQQSQQKNFLLILLSALALAGFFVYRSIYLKRKNERLRLENELTVQRLESERKHAELKRQASDLQMQALRAQMNPHFIFNSLSSINWFIMENDKDTASDYLTRFSRLMRMVLNAQKPTIPLDDELKMLQLYLDMERLRLDNSFDYSITFTNAIDAGNVSIPPMLLQPFCENAIWHGFKNKEGQGHLNINIRTEDHLFECTITDDGIGRKQAALFKKKSSKNDGSMGLGITRERLALFSEENNAEADFEMDDLVDEIGQGAGTRVVLKIIYKEFVEDEV
jgi:tetratricopeptide (TPR) repeat protein